LLLLATSFCYASLSGDISTFTPVPPLEKRPLKNRIISAILQLIEIALSRRLMKKHERFAAIGAWRLITVFGTKRLKKTRSKRNTENSLVAVPKQANFL
jgi:hypothetical protein